MARTLTPVDGDGHVVEDGAVIGADRRVGVGLVLAAQTSLERRVARGGERDADVAPAPLGCR